MSKRCPSGMAWHAIMHSVWRGRTPYRSTSTHTHRPFRSTLALAIFKRAAFFHFISLSRLILFAFLFAISILGVRLVVYNRWHCDIDTNTKMD